MLKNNQFNHKNSIVSMDVVVILMKLKKRKNYHQEDPAIHSKCLTGRTCNFYLLITPFFVPLLQILIKFVTSPIKIVVPIKVFNRYNFRGIKYKYKL